VYVYLYFAIELYPHVKHIFQFIPPLCIHGLARVSTCWFVLQNVRCHPLDSRIICINIDIYKIYIYNYILNLALVPLRWTQTRGCLLPPCEARAS